MTYLLFIIGFALLIKGADYLVDGSASLAKKLKIPAIVIGLTIIAFGTSHPCLTFDKWRALLIVDDDFRVREVVTTYF